MSLSQVNLSTIVKQRITFANTIDGHQTTNTNSYDFLLCLQKDTNPPTSTQINNDHRQLY